MKKHLIYTALISALLSGHAWAQRIVTLTPDVADVVVALGAADQVVARDMTTTQPSLQSKPSIGVFRQLSAEPIAAHKPDIAIGSWMAQPPGIYTRLQGIGIRAVNVAPKESLDTYAQSIRDIGTLLGKSKEADALAQRWQNRLTRHAATGKRYLISYDGRIVAGRNTAADELIRRAGGINAAAAIDGLKPMSREAWLAAKPDIVIVSAHHRQAVGGAEGLLKRPELAASPAAQQRKVYFWDANDVLRFGLDTPQVIERLHRLAR